MMTRAKMHLLLFLLKQYRAHLCWGGDRYEKHASAMIRDIRFALEHGAFYRIKEMELVL